MGIYHFPLVGKRDGRSTGDQVFCNFNFSNHTRIIQLKPVGTVQPLFEARHLLNDIAIAARFPLRS